MWMSLCHLPIISLCPHSQSEILLYTPLQFTQYLCSLWRSSCAEWSRWCQNSWGEVRRALPSMVSCEKTREGGNPFFRVRVPLPLIVSAGYKVEWEEESSDVSCVYTLMETSIDPQVHVRLWTESVYVAGIYSTHVYLSVCMCECLSVCLAFLIEQSEDPWGFVSVCFVFVFLSKSRWFASIILSTLFDDFMFDYLNFLSTRLLILAR